MTAPHQLLRAALERKIAEVNSPDFVMGHRSEMYKIMDNLMKSQFSHLNYCKYGHNCRSQKEYYIYIKIDVFDYKYCFTISCINFGPWTCELKIEPIKPVVVKQDEEQDDDDEDRFF